MRTEVRSVRGWSQRMRSGASRSRRGTDCGGEVAAWSGCDGTLGGQLHFDPLITLEEGVDLVGGGMGRGDRPLHTGPG